MPKATCPSCSRAIQLVRRADGSQVALDMEVVQFVPADRHGGVRDVAVPVPGRQLHAAMCATYQRATKRPQRRPRSSL